MPPAANMTQPVNILLVDDRHENLVALSAILSDPDFNLVTARSGKEALRCLLQQEFAAILLDVNMPEMDGFETAAVFRQRPSTAHTPIIFVTAFSDEEHVFRGYSLGAVDYIQSPVQPTVLRAKVAVFVDLFRKTAEIQRQSELLREAEQKLRRQAELALADIEERFRVTFNQAAVGMALIAPGGQWIDVNEKFCDILQCTRATLLRRTLGELLTVHSTGESQHPDPLALDHDSMALEAWALAPNGRRIWLHLATSVVRAPSGEPKYLIAVMEDVTARREAEQQLKALNDELEQRVAERTEALRQSHDRLRRSERLASLGTLAAGIAHEINNPINAVLLSAQYAMEMRGEPEAAQTVDETLASIVKEAKRCGTIVKNVLRFSKEEKTPKTPCQLNEVVNRAVALARTYIQAPGLTLSAATAAGLPEVMINVTQMEQVIINLIQNAVQAANGRVCVELRTDCTAGGVRLSVSDNGPGIPPDKLSHIFDPFFSTRQSQGGTGLGLSIAHGIINDHGATIDVHSRPGQGTTFVMQFPLPVECGAPA